MKTKLKGKFMEKLRIALLIILSCSVSALNTHFESEEEIKFANELFTQKEKDWSNIWTFDFSKDATYVEGFSKLSDVKVPPVFTVPHFKFYKSPDLSGEVFAQIDDKGLKMGDDYICHIERGSKATFILTQKKSWDSFEDGKSSRVDLEDDNRKIQKSVVLCKDFFLYVKPGSGHHFTLQTTFPVINHKIGKVKMRGVDVYFDATPWINAYSAENDALTTLKKVLTQDDFDQIYELVKKLRKLIEAEDKEGIFTFVTGKKMEILTEPGRYTNTNPNFGIKQQEFLDFKFNDTKKSNLLKATTFIYKRAGGAKHSENTMSVSVYGVNVSNLSLQKYDGSWRIKKISLRSK